MMTINGGRAMSSAAVRGRNALKGNSMRFAAALLARGCRLHLRQAVLGLK
jgi:hypothetical protein